MQRAYHRRTRRPGHRTCRSSRRDWQHKLSTAIIRDNQAVYVEDLCVVGPGRTRLAKSVHDAGWASFTARWGRAFAKIDRFAPTSQTCSACGRLDGPKPLSVRSWTCPCGAVHDRDVNAAINVLAQGRRDNSNACGTRVRPALVPAPRPTSRRETGIHPGAACSTPSVEGISVLQGREIVKKRSVPRTYPGTSCSPWVY
jgi:putative transposase